VQGLALVSIGDEGDGGVVLALDGDLTQTAREGDAAGDDDEHHGGPAGSEETLLVRFVGNTDHSVSGEEGSEESTAKHDRAEVATSSEVLVDTDFPPSAGVPGPDRHTEEEHEIEGDEDGDVCEDTTA
jgi:hypothetical protein